MLRCYGRPVIGFTEAKQRELFAQHGVKSRDGAPIYFDTARTFPAQRKALVRSLRSGAKDEVGVATLYVLASNRRDLREVLADIKSSGATIRELATGRVLHPDDCANAVLDAVHWWSSRNKRFGELSIAEAASLGGKALSRIRAQSRMPKREALPIWRDDTLSSDEALAKINADKRYGRKWSMTQIYDKEVGLGPRKVFAGRRPKKKD